jgi:FkbM family methyltransferase
MTGNAIYRAGYRCLRKLRFMLPEYSTPERSSAMAASVLRWTREKLVPKSNVWVQVERGITKGLWLRLQLPEEAFLWRGEHEPGVQTLLATYLRPGWVTYDVGSYVGFFALAMAQAVGFGGQVVAFEPDPESVVRLREHVARNHMERCIRVVKAAAWDKSADQILYRRGSQARSQGGVEAGELRPVLASGERIAVRSISLDEFVAQGNPVPQLVKIDVEGGETAVLAGAEGLIMGCRPLIICEVHHAVAAGWLQKWFAERGYCLDWMIPPEEFPRHLVATPAPSTN